MKYPLSLIVAVYNKPFELELVLAACARQTLTGFQIIIADDGSDASVGEVISKAHTAMQTEILHVRHEDKGWRKNIILNKAVQSAQSDYLVFIDGDCIPHHRFLEDHQSEKESNTLLAGRRVEMSADWSKKITLDSVRSGSFEKIGIREWWDGIRGRSVRVEDGLRFENIRFRNILHNGARGLLGSNFSLHKRDLEAINGFDEEYDGPGCGEDSDIQYRLSLLGEQTKSLRHRAIQYHFFHERNPVSQQCVDRFELVKRNGRSWCDNGLVKSTHS